MCGVKNHMLFPKWFQRSWRCPHGLGTPKGCVLKLKPALPNLCFSAVNTLSSLEIVKTLRSLYGVWLGKVHCLTCVKLNRTGQTIWWNRYPALKPLRRLTLKFDMANTHARNNPVLRENLNIAVRQMGHFRSLRSDAIPCSMSCICHPLCAFPSVYLRTPFLVNIDLTSCSIICSLNFSRLVTLSLEEPGRSTSITSKFLICAWEWHMSTQPQIKSTQQNKPLVNCQTTPSHSLVAQQKLLHLQAIGPRCRRKRNHQLRQRWFIMTC